MSNERERAEIEARLKRLLAGLARPVELPKVPDLPPGMSPEMKFVYDVLNERISALDKQLKAIYKLAWRTSAAVVGMMLPVFGWDFVGRLVSILGG